MDQTDRQRESETIWDRAASSFTRWRDGEEEALDTLVVEMTPVLWQIVRAYRLSPEIAEDVIQGTWLALVRSRDKVSDPQAVGRWLTTTTRRAAWRASSREGRDRTVDPIDLEPLTPSVDSAETRALERDESNLLWKAVHQLDERCQRLIRVVAFSPRPDYVTLSGALNMPVGSIGPTRGRCLAKLRTLLGNGSIAGRTS